MLKKWMSDPRTALLIIALPGILHFLVFKYIPLLGNVIVFQDYDMFRGISGSRWVGFKHFVTMFEYEDFANILWNTVVLSLYRLLFGFPAPLVLALLLNEIRHAVFKRSVQTVLYFPHFLSWVIVGGIFIRLLDTEGILNDILTWFGVERIPFLEESVYFRSVIVWSAIWKEVGWGMIIYLAAMAGINPNLYEAAVMDGANRWRQIAHITLPALVPAIVVLFLLRIGNLLDTGVEEVLMFLNPLVRDVGEVIDTYVYRVGLLESHFSYTTAIGFFKSIVGLILVVGLNRLSKKMTGESIY
ncbi:sugar ABC transporter permease [Paenibacillus hemerocallicola]|uniref:Sugar ABC transporter permease n=1 Tax=Paenibacillus hemerocallicola TaxID=1172614 RepID=A0A5C4TDK9_9BACL|nr:ABC transporter permease subunit [Paenibacillus hemerocallicola]TNJ66985.1 sugar ABC transporter permease [Paenibacillus hemerocallicola]